MVHHPTFLIDKLLEGKERMSSYYSNSSDQRGGIMPSIYVRDAGQIQYPDSSSVQHNMLYANYSDSLPITSQSQQHYIQLPASSSITSQEQFPGGPENAYNIYNSSSRDGRGEMLLMQTIGGPHISAENFVQSSHLGILDGQKLSLQQPKGLSLSLGTEIPVQSFQYQTPLISGLPGPGPGRDESPRHSHVHMNSSPFGIPNFASAIPNSKYLKAAQELLEEVVNVREALKQKTERSLSLHNSTDGGGSKSEKATSNPQESTENSSPEISPSERQELQNKVTKLLAMLDEVDRRYKQYYHQMQLVVSSFDAIAGQGAAKPYTALALQTISRHFRCLRDAITTQIKNARKTLGEKESSGGNGVGISRLRYIEQQIRQQRAMQQFGMMQPHAWRPQRGLPENSVSILRAWLFEHFLHPYPKDSEKLMLAKQTGLTRGQVANWFINARVRLWKPMIEEMYKEEIGDTEVDSNNSSSENNNNNNNNNNPPKVHNEMKSSEDMEEAQLSAASDRCQTSQFNHNHFKSNLMPDSNISVDDPYMNLKLRDQISNGENCSILQEALGHSDGNERLMAYQMGEMSRFGNSGVSLTLGLQGGGLPISDGHQNFMSMREEDMYGSDQPPSIGREDFEYMNVGDQRHRFGPSHLLHDFVA